MICKEKLTSLRTKHNITTKELAKLLQFPESYIIDLEQGKKKATPKIAHRIIELFQVEEEDLLEPEWQSDLTQYLGDKIRALRESRNMSLVQLSTLTDLSVSYLSEVERMETTPSLSTMRQISQVFNVPISLFVGNKRKCLLVVEKLKRARMLKGLSQKELAAQSGISAGLIGQLETGKVQASLKTLEKICSALGISVCAVILEQEEIEEVIGALSPELRELLYQPQVQSILGSTCTMPEHKLKLVLNFVAMLNNPELD